jgi:hypothetical protein
MALTLREGYGGDMARDDHPSSDHLFEQRVHKALKTPPISNEEIERRSKERRKG